MVGCRIAVRLDVWAMTERQRAAPDDEETSTMPKYLMLITETEDSYTGADEAQFAKVMEMHNDFSKAVADAGASVLGGEALQPTATATYLRNTRTPDVAVVDNPAPDLKEVLGGYYLIEAADDAQAAGCQAVPRAVRLHRGTSDLGVQRLSTLPADVALVAAEAQRAYWGRVLAGTMRLSRDLDIAEEATADAFVLALQTWPERGVPDSVEAWLLTTARRRAIDKIRRASALRTRLAEIASSTDWTADGADAGGGRGGGARRRVPARRAVLPPGAGRGGAGRADAPAGCGAPTAAIASAFLVPVATMAARLTRAKQRVATSGTGIELPDYGAVDERLPAVRRVVHLAYTLGDTAAAGDHLRDDDWPSERYGWPGHCTRCDPMTTRVRAS